MSTSSKSENKDAPKEAENKNPADTKKKEELKIEDVLKGYQEALTWALPATATATSTDFSSYKIYIIIGVSTVVLAIITYFVYRWWSNKNSTIPSTTEKQPNAPENKLQTMDADAEFIKGKSNQNKSKSKSKYSSSDDKSKKSPNLTSPGINELKSPLSLMPSPTSNSYRMNNISLVT
jgi:hypothetical protein